MWVKWEARSSCLLDLRSCESRLPCNSNQHVPVFVPDCSGWCFNAKCHRFCTDNEQLFVLIRFRSLVIVFGYWSCVFIYERPILGDTLNLINLHVKSTALFSEKHCTFHFSLRFSLKSTVLFTFCCAFHFSLHFSLFTVFFTEKHCTFHLLLHFHFSLCFSLISTKILWFNTDLSVWPGLS